METDTSSAISVSDLYRQEQIKKVCRYFLISSNHMKPVTKTNLKSHIKVDFNRSMFNSVSEKLSQDYGYDLVEYSKDKFIIRKKYSSENVSRSSQPAFSFDHETSAKNGLIFMISCCILMSGNEMSYLKLLQTLKIFGLNEGRNHDVFGDIRNFLTKQLVKEGFLKIEIENAVNNETATIDPIMNARVKLGSRTVAMVDKNKVLEFVAKTYGNDPEDWREQFEALQLS